MKQGQQLTRIRLFFQDYGASQWQSWDSLPVGIWLTSESSEEQCLLIALQAAFSLHHIFLVSFSSLLLLMSLPAKSTYWTGTFKGKWMRPIWHVQTWVESELGPRSGACFNVALGWNVLPWFQYQTLKRHFPVVHSHRVDWWSSLRTWAADRTQALRCSFWGFG